VPAPVSPELAQDLASISVSSGRCSLTSPKAGQQRYFSLCAETGRSRQEHLLKWVAILAPTYKPAQ
jgi:hypothetical protein